ncbi:MAG: histidine--tRNA ligase, partial [Candidatus Cloacimonetes bacterium]|nr:histidine--tRNA ligase [Candidatus Cloacimonadota bacterium]
NSFKAQLKAANNCQARFALIIGEDEAAAGKALLKDLQSGEQHLLELDATSQFIEALKHR